MGIGIGGGVFLDEDLVGVIGVVCVFEEVVEVYFV